jgi:hypothetical protein
MNRPRVLLVGPLPPPANGMSVITQVLVSSALQDDFELLHLDTSDRRDLSNIGRLDIRNVVLGFWHASSFVFTLVRWRPRVCHIPIARTRVELIYLPIAKHRLGFLCLPIPLRGPSAGCAGSSVRRLTGARHLGRSDPRAHRGRPGIAEVIAAPVKRAEMSRAARARYERDFTAERSLDGLDAIWRSITADNDRTPKEPSESPAEAVAT